MSSPDSAPNPHPVSDPKPKRGRGRPKKPDRAPPYVRTGRPRGRPRIYPVETTGNPPEEKTGSPSTNGGAELQALVEENRDLKRRLEDLTREVESYNAKVNLAVGALINAGFGSESNNSVAFDAILKLKQLASSHSQPPAQPHFE